VLALSYFSYFLIFILDNTKLCRKRYLLYIPIKGKRMIFKEAYRVGNNALLLLLK
jgi:hypothetical protein